MEPRDIESRTFAIARRGYDREEVDAFLRRVAEEYERLQASIAEAPPPSEAAYGNIGSHVSAVLAAAAKAAEDMRTTAELQAEEILDEARKKAAELSESAEENFEKSRDARARSEHEAALLKAAARDEIAQLMQEAENKSALIEAEAKERATKLERIARVNVETILAEGRAQYGRLQRAIDVLADRLASLEAMIHEVRTEVSAVESEVDVADPHGREAGALQADWLDTVTSPRSERADGMTQPVSVERRGGVGSKSTGSRGDRGRTRSAMATARSSQAQERGGTSAPT